jgi:hypothetical protein
VPIKIGSLLEQFRDTRTKALEPAEFRKGEVVADQT